MIVEEDDLEGEKDLDGRFNLHRHVEKNTRCCPCRCARNCLSVKIKGRVSCPAIISPIAKQEYGFVTCIYIRFF